MSSDHLTAFQQALLDSVLSEYADIPREETLPDPFSDRFKTWAADFAPRHKPGRIRAVTVLKRILIAAVIMLLLAGAAMAIPAIREAIIDYFFHADATQIGVTFDPARAATAPDKIEKPYTLNYVPNAFTLTMEIVEQDCINLWWAADNNQWISFMQIPMPYDPEEAKWWGYDAAGTTRKSVLMGDYLVEIIEDVDNYKLIWTNNEYLFTLELPDSVSEEEMNAIFASWGPRQ